MAENPKNIMSVSGYSGHPITKRNLTTILAVLIMVVVNAECFAQARQKFLYLKF